MATAFSNDSMGAPAPQSGWIIATGVLLLIAGIAAIFAPGLTTMAASIAVGWILLLIGIAGIVMGVRSRHRRWTDLLLGALSILVALSVLFDPLTGAVSLTLAFTVWLLVRGVIELVSALSAEGRPEGRGLLALVGVLDLLLGVLLFLNFPFPAVQALGIFVGISLLMGGVVTLVTAAALRRAGA